MLARISQQKIPLRRYEIHVYIYELHFEKNIYEPKLKSRQPNQCKKSSANNISKWNSKEITSS